MHISNPDIFIPLVSSAIIFSMGMLLLFLSIPKDPFLKSYRTSRRFLAIAYIILAIIGFIGIFTDEEIHKENIVTLFQALLFTYSLITLINQEYVTKRRLLHQLLLIAFISSLILFNLYVLPESNKLLSYISSGCYLVLFVYYVWVFGREYRRYINKMDNFYSGNERRRMKWVLEVFIMAAIIGAFGGIAGHHNIAFRIFIIAYTLLYVYLGIRYINYIFIFYYLKPALSKPTNEPVLLNNADSIRIGIDEWIAQKHYINPEITLESLARDLKTNQSYLSRYINSSYGQNFRSWINTLRIKESMYLIDTHENFSFDEICEMIGITSRSTFYRQFSAITGITPAEYRKNHNKKRSNNK